MPLTRRDILGCMGAFVAAGFLSRPSRARCEPPDAEPPKVERPPPFETFDVSGSYREIGRGIGGRFAQVIRAVLAESGTFEECRAAGAGPAKAKMTALESAARGAFPHLVEELEGLALGLGVPFADIFAWNCRSEIGAATNACPPGCSTIGYAGGGRFALGHNEDGGDEFLGRMFVVRARPPSGVGFACLVYPGTLPGNGPGLNAHGIVQATNYIAPCAVPDGIPRYFIGRAVLEARTLDEAVGLATTAGRAFPWHHNLGALAEGRLVSLETGPGRHSVQNVDGVHLHTNHLTHPAMIRDFDENRTGIESSSAPRMRALRRFVEDRTPGSPRDLLDALCDRTGAPCKVFRQPGDDVPGVTVAAALFESPALEMQLHGGPPCSTAPQRVRPPA